MTSIIRGRGCYEKRSALAFLESTICNPIVVKRNRLFIQHRNINDRNRCCHSIRAVNESIVSRNNRRCQRCYSYYCYHRLCFYRNFSDISTSNVQERPDEEITTSTVELDDLSTHDSNLNSLKSDDEVHNSDNSNDDDDDDNDENDVNFRYEQMNDVVEADSSDIDPKPVIELHPKKSLVLRKVPNTIKLRIVHNEFDLLHMISDQDNASLYHVCKYNMESIKRTIYNDYYDEEIPDDNTMMEQNDYIEYLDDYMWKPLMSIDDISPARYKGGITPLQIRLSKYYPEEYRFHTKEERKEVRRSIDLDTEKLRDELYYIHDKDSQYIRNQLTRIIRALILLIKYEGYVRDTIKPYVLYHTATQMNITTRTYVLHQAQLNTNPELQYLLLNQPNSLQHIINMIHYDFIWNKYTYK